MTLRLQNITVHGQVEKEWQPSTIVDYLRRLPQSCDNPGQSIRGLYLHIPFCFHKCHYCDFYSVVDPGETAGPHTDCESGRGSGGAGRDSRHRPFVSRMIEEIRAVAAIANGPIETVFIGGGTPTLLAPDLLGSLLRTIRECFALTPDTEFTIEANPETISCEIVDSVVDAGVNRVSVGCQSFNSRHLKTLERWHDPENVDRSIERLRTTGIDNINLDLIFAIPGQTLDDWIADLRRAVELRPHHLSCYGLMYEPNTPMTARLRDGSLSRVDEEEEAAMYEATCDLLGKTGYEHYEISNWAKVREGLSVAGSHAASRDMSSRTSSGNRNLTIDYASLRCRHNMLYWTNGNWWGLGPGACGHVNGLRWRNVPRLTEYLDARQSAPADLPMRESTDPTPWPRVTDVELLDEDGRIGEQFMLSLRLIEGMCRADVERLLAAGRNGDQRREAIEQSIADDLLMWHEQRLQLTPRGRLLADTVLAELI